MTSIHTIGHNTHIQPDNIDAEESYAEAVHYEAGCPDTKCVDLDSCDICAEFVCPDHTVDATACMEHSGIHHPACALECDACAEVRALDLAGAWTR